MHLKINELVQDHPVLNEWQKIKQFSSNPAKPTIIKNQNTTQLYAMASVFVPAKASEIKSKVLPFHKALKMYAAVPYKIPYSAMLTPHTQLAGPYGNRKPRFGFVVTNLYNIDGGEIQSSPLSDECGGYCTPYE